LSTPTEGPAEGADDHVQEAPAVPAPPLELRDARPAVIATSAELASYCAAIAGGSGPVAIDAERASGYRYSQRAYLIQVRREGAGIGLIDPIAFADLTELNDAIGAAEWILHAATQDLPCLTDVGLRPHVLFDTELAGRLLNLPRVGLATLVEHYFGKSMAKEHSAVDWSTRPLPDSWLEYAALDVEVLIELRELLAAELEANGKLDWAKEEFEALLSFSGPPRREDPWRRTSGLHRARGRRALGIVREVWETRDAIAQRRDVSPGRILPDASILELATTPPKSMPELKDMRIMRNRGPRRFLDEWFDAVSSALALPEAQLPTGAPRSDGPPPPRVWNDKNPEAAARLGRSRDVILRIAGEANLPAENLLSPATVRALAWSPPSSISTDTVSEALTTAGARPWQIALTSEALAAALVEQ
jgi:ribonuclease D